MSLITKYEFEAPEEGIKLLILAAVHGNETAGTKACNRLMAELNSGMVTLKKAFDHCSGLQSRGISQRCPVCGRESEPGYDVS